MARIDDTMAQFLRGELSHKQCIESLMYLAKILAWKLAKKIMPFPEKSFLLRELTAEAYFILCDMIHKMPKDHKNPVGYLIFSIKNQLLRYHIENHTVRVPERSALRVGYSNLPRTVPLDEAVEIVNKRIPYDVEIFEWRDSIIKTRYDKIILYYRLMGYTVAEIAKILGQSTRTVNEEIQVLAARILAIKGLE